MDEAEVNRIKQYVAVIARGVFVIVSVFVLTLLAGIYVIKNVLPTTYSATAVIAVRPHAVLNSGIGTNQDSVSSPSTWMAEIQNIKAPSVLTPVLQQLNLEAVWKDRLFKNRDPWTTKEALVHLQNVLKVDLKQGTNIVTITASSDVPQEAADIPNAVADQYKLVRDREDTERIDHDKDTINEQIDQQQQVVEEKKTALEQLRSTPSGSFLTTTPESGKEVAPETDAYRAAQRDLERQKSLLDAFTLHLRQVMDDAQKWESAVHIMARAEVPLASSHPNRHFQMIVTIVIATLLSLGIASSVEIVFLLLRAAKRPENS